MRCGVLLLFLVVCCLGGTTGNSALDVAALLKIGVRLVLLNLQKAGNVTLTDSSTFNIPDELKNVTVGSLKVDSTHIYGFDNLNINSLTTENLESPENSTKTNLCMDLDISLLGLSSLYDADVGILNEIPIYGNGELNLAVSKLNIDICLNLITEENFSVLYIEDLVLQLKLHDSLSYITGFWKSDEVSDIVTLVINVLEQLICMFISYETECVSCVASEIVEFMINTIISPKDAGNINIDCSCIKAAFNGRYNIEEKLEKLITSYYQGATYSLTEKENRDLKELLEELLGYIVQILHGRGLKF